MDDIHYSTLNPDDKEARKRIARIHQEQPLDWIEGYQVVEEAVESTYNEMITPHADSTSTVLVAHDAGGTLVGFHWISVNTEREEATARVHSLWVHKAYRRRGIARRLKALGEDWMREGGAVRVTTEVFYVNKKMIDLNIKLGFTPWQVEMTKDL
jgi:GNAT superfamily N-acetyltransferase